jgi:hypothetical protein
MRSAWPGARHRTRQLVVLATAIALFACGSTAAAAPRADAAKTPKCGGKKVTKKGTRKADRIKGTRKADVIAGLGGKDTIKGLARNDTVCGGAGNDKLYGNGGRDTLIGGKGRDTCLGGPARDRIRSCEVGDGVVNRPGVPPVVTMSSGGAAWTEGGGPVAVDAGITVSDLDSLALRGATVRASRNHVAGQDELGFINQLGITGTYDSGTGVLTLTGSASVADYQTALRSVTYGNSSDAPSTSTRTLTVQVTDPTSLPSNTSTRDVTLTATNDTPKLATSSGSTVYADGDPAVPVDPGLTLTDPDDSTVQGAVVRISQGFAAGDELTFVDQSGITGTYNPGTAVWTLTGSATPADYQAALRSVQFDHTGSPAPPSRTIEFTATDGHGESAPATKVVAKHPPPVATNDSFNAVGNTGRFVGTTRPAGQAGWETGGSVLDNDTNVDSPGSPLHAEPQTAAATTLGGTVTIDDDGSFTYQPQVGDTGTDSFTYRVCDASPCNSGTAANSTGTVNITLVGEVWYVKNNASAGGDGTSDTPFDTLLEGETSSGTNDTTFVYDGDNTTTNYGSGYAMNAGERLLGEVAGLSIDPDGGGSLNTVALLGATPGAYPTLTASNEDVVLLDDANEVRGFTLDPQGTGGGIEGAAGDTGGGTIADVRVLDTGTLGLQPGVELTGTTGTFDFQDLVVSTNGVGAVSLDNAGTARFADTGTISLTASGAAALDVFNTSMGPGSTFDDITVTGSGSGAVSMVNTTGTTTFGDGTGTDLALTTTSGATPAFRLSTAGTVSVPGSTANVSATGGPAVAVSGTSGATLGFGTVSSTNSTGTGIILDGLGTGTFSAAGGAITGAAGIAVDVNGGSGDVSYPGALDNGAGATAEITGRTGGAVSLSGAIADTNDAGGGIAVTGNTGGSTTFSNAAKTLNTGASAAVQFGTSDGHTLTLSGGGLDIDTTTAAGLDATNSGTLVVSGTGNTIDTTSGRALNVSATDIGASGLTFQSIASNGSANGINLTGTGSAGGLTVTGSGSSLLGGDNSGGTIQSTAGPAISLANTTGPSFRNMRLLNSQDSGVNGTQVNGFSFLNGKITGAGDADDENSITFDDSAANANVTGVVTITNNIISDTEAAGVDIQNNTGTIADANISGNTLDDTGDVATAGSAVSLVALGSASTVASVTKAELTNNTITDFRAGAGFVVQGGNGTLGGPSGKVGTAGNGTEVIAITGNFMNGGNGGIGNQPDRFATAGVHGVGQGNFNVSNNGSNADRIRNIDCVAIEIEADGPVTLTSSVQNNFINANSAVGCAGIAVGTDSQFAVTDAGTHTATISGNNVMGTDGPGILPIVRNSASTLNVKVQNNTVAAPIATNAARAGIRVDSGSASGDTTLCLNISGNTTAGSTNTGTATTSPGINLRKQGTDPAVNSFAINGMPATSSPGVENYVNGLNTSTSGTFGIGGTALLSAQSGFTNCSLP